MGGAAGVGNPRLGTDRTGGPDRAYGRIANGCTAMNPRRLRLGFILAAAGMLCGAATTLALLRDPGVGGSAAAGFWAMVLAVWLGAAFCVIQLASMRPRDDASRRALNLAVPLLFGAVVFY